MNKMLLAHAAAAAAALSAGAAVVATRFVIGETDPISLVFYRYLISIICFAPFLQALWPRDALSASECAKIAMFGILFFVLFPWAFNESLNINPAARGAVGLATMPRNGANSGSVMLRINCTKPAFERAAIKASKNRRASRA